MTYLTKGLWKRKGSGMSEGLTRKWRRLGGRRERERESTKNGFSDKTDHSRERLELYRSSEICVEYRKF